MCLHKKQSDGEWKMVQIQGKNQNNNGGIIAALIKAGYSEIAANYYIEKPHMGSIADADQVADYIGSCGDTMKIYLNFEDGNIKEAKYEVMGCAGAISAAMAAVDIITGKSIEFAKNINDGDIFNALQDIPEQKHHCIQLAVKTLHKALADYEARG